MIAIAPSNVISILYPANPGVISVIKFSYFRVFTNKFYEKFENRIKDSYNILISTMYEMGVHVLHLDDFTNIAWALTGVDPFGSTNYERDTEDNSSNLTETKMRNKARDMLYFAPKVYSRQENEELKPRLYAFLNQHLKPIEELEKEHEEEIKASELEQEKKRKKNK
jgi:hypothetical protein